MSPSGQTLTQSDGFPSPSAKRLMILSALVAVCAGYTNMTTMPLWTEYLIRSHLATETPTLLCGSVELAGGALASILYARLALSHRVSISLRVAAAVLIVANLGSVALLRAPAFSLPAFGLSRFIAGFGSGALLAIVNARTARTAFAERLFIGAHIAYGVYASALFFVLPSLMQNAEQHEGVGSAPAFWVIAGAGVLVALVASLADAGDQHRPRQESARLRGSSVAYLLMLMFFFCGFTSIFTFWERFGVHAGLSVAVVSHMLSAASLVSLIGMGFALLAADRLGLIGPITVCLVVLALSALISSHGGLTPPPLGHYLFGAAVIADQTSAIIIVPFSLSLMALDDSSGALTGAAPSAMSIGNVVGPTIATLLGRAGYEWIGWMAIAFYGVGFLILLLRWRFSQTSPARPKTAPVA